MEKEIIDVEYTDVEDEKDNKKGGDITVNADPLSTLISETFGIVNNFTNAVKEYNICKQQEQTKRAAIKAQMKVEIEKIHMQRDAIMRCLEQQHELKLQSLKHTYDMSDKALNAICDAIHGAIEVAKNSGDFTEVIHLIEVESKFLNDRSEIELKQMELSGKQGQIQLGNNVKGFIE